MWALSIGVHFSRYILKHIVHEPCKKFLNHFFFILGSKRNVLIWVKHLYAIPCFSSSISLDNSLGFWLTLWRFSSKLVSSSPSKSLFLLYPVSLCHSTAEGDPFATKKVLFFSTSLVPKLPLHIWAMWVQILALSPWSSGHVSKENPFLQTKVCMRGS